MSEHTLTYSITFYSDWHCGSGLSGGAETDADLIKDSNDLPYIPGKTIKGLLKHSLNEIKDTQPDKIDMSLFEQIFGSVTQSGNAFFSNATIDRESAEAIISGSLKDHLYRNIASTQITELGVAKENSLRVMEVCMPLTLYGQITLQDNEGELNRITNMLRMACQWTRVLGANRNRGLGRCKFELLNGNQNEN